MKNRMRTMLSLTMAAALAAPMVSSVPVLAEEGEGAVLNIEVWNNEFCNRMADHYPGFEANDPEDSTKGGKIGDVAINFIVTNNQDNAYQTNLDEALGAQADAAADDKVDIFLVEA